VAVLVRSITTLTRMKRIPYGIVVYEKADSAPMIPAPAHQHAQREQALRCAASNPIPPFGEESELQRDVSAIARKTPAAGPLPRHTCQWRVTGAKLAQRIRCGEAAIWTTEDLRHREPRRTARGYDDSQSTVTWRALKTLAPPAGERAEGTPGC